ncbi:MAG: hypothetical protein ACKVUT_03620 [Gaiella sp.]
MGEQRPYWSERHGRAPVLPALDESSLMRMATNVVLDFLDRDYFQEAFGYYCVDAGEVAGTAGRDVADWFLHTIRRDSIWPFATHRETWDSDTLFDVLELLFDVVSRPVSGRYHDFSGCGWHYSTFDREAGRDELRAELNLLLERCTDPLTLSESGEIVHAIPAPFEPLLRADVPYHPDGDLVESRIRAATEVFQRRQASSVDRRHAVRELADALEPLRSEIKTEALSKDERALFELANGFAIRHNNREQARLYDDEIWLRWAFYVYLATIHAVLRLRARQRADGENAGQN